MTSRSPGTTEPRDLLEEVVVPSQVNSGRPVVRYRVLLHERHPVPGGAARIRPVPDESAADDSGHCGRPWRRIAADLAGGPPITAPMAALALMVVLCYSAIMVAAFGTAGGIVVLALGVTAIATLFLIGRR